MTRPKIALFGTIAGFALALATPAFAQKAKDTFRLPLKFPIDFIAYPYSGNINETQFSTMAVFDTLVMFDEDAKKFVPGLAKSWKQIDPKTIEFELRDDVKWHDGQPFTADDVVYTINWVSDENSKIRFRTNWEWLKGAEKIGRAHV